MTVSSVSYSGTSSSDNEASIKQLESQLKTVQKQITEENQSSDDAQTKQTELEALQAQESQIYAEIQQVQNQSTQNQQSNESLLSAQESASVKEAGKGNIVDLSA